MLSLEELRGRPRLRLRGRRRVKVVGGKRVWRRRSGKALVAGRARAKAWREANPERYRAAIAKWERAHPGAAAKRLAKWTVLNPERRREQVNAAQRRYWRKKHPRGGEA